MTPAIAWPPLRVPAHHQPVDVSVFYLGADACDPQVTCTIAVASNEPDSGTAAADGAPDWEILDGAHLRLRAEHSSRGRGRQYTIAVTCTDDPGNATVRTTAVLVPRFSNYSARSNLPFPIAAGRARICRPGARGCGLGRV
jgi:hypothetical protein